MKTTAAPTGQGGPMEQWARTNAVLERIGRRIVVMSGKGGVGKTTVAVNLATALAAAGNRVGIMDVDIHGPNVPKMLGLDDSQMVADAGGMLPVEGPGGLKVVSVAFILSGPDTPVIWRGPLKTQLIDQFLGDMQWGDLDYLVVDLPPGTGDESLSIAQKIPGAEALIVTTPQEVALLDSRKAVNFARQLGLPVLGIVENMSGFTCPHCGQRIDLFKTDGGRRAAGEMDVPFLGAVPIEPGVVEAGDSGRPIVLASPDSAAANAFRAMVDSITERGGEPNAG